MLQTFRCTRKSSSGLFIPNGKTWGLAFGNVGQTKIPYNCEFNTNNFITFKTCSIRSNSTYQKSDGNPHLEKHEHHNTSERTVGGSAPYYIPKIPRTTMTAQQSLRRLPSTTAATTRLPLNMSDPASFLKHEQHETNIGLPSPDHSSVLSQLKSSYQPCTTISTSEKYDLVKVIDAFYSKGLRSASIILPGEVAHAQYTYAPGQTADVLVISNGSVVVWGMAEKEVLDRIVPMIKDAEISSYSEPESEDMDYIEEPLDDLKIQRQSPSTHILEPNHNDHHDRHNTPVYKEGSVVTEEKSYDERSESFESNRASESDTANHSIHESHATVLSDVLSHTPRSTMIGDVIVIRGNNYTSRLLAKAAFSSGLARSTKLANLEDVLDKHITTTKKYIDNLATGRELGIRAKTVLRLTGQLLRIRGHLNLYSELIETPDLYWSEPELEELYMLISKKLDVTPRITILNKKLDYASESLSTLRSHISEENSVRLEWMIIILIMVEVAFEITHFVEKYYVKAEKALALAWDKTEKETKA